ncbi:MAG TPA: NAD(P)H-dependent oxidoreductase [Kofleriaceae bacterium]|jgi:chromate reductase|nr:NAD(P)H-dependent oxidoreductase [Kofleriaceae bacterium]
MTLRLLGVAGSLRKASLNRALLRAIADALPAGAATLELFDGLGALPTFDPDSPAEPEPVARWKQALAAADGVVIATPEYNYSIPGVLKNAIDWASRPPPTSPLRNKPMGIVSAATGISGGMRAQYHLRQILVYTNSPVMLQPEVILPRAHERFDAAGQLADASTGALLAAFGAGLIEWIGRFRPTAVSA